MHATSEVIEPHRSGFLNQIESELPDTQRAFARLDRWPVQLAICLVTGLIFRAAMFGDPAYHIDEAWYFLVGQWMHEGALPYVDVWDRKPFLLFGLFYLFAGISDSVLAYQIPAWIAASLTAFVIVRVTRRWTGPQGALLAGGCYLALIGTLTGMGGQSPVFYNLLIATAALLMVQSLDQLREGQVPARVYVAMLLSGVAIMIKQTTLFESVFFGLWATYLLWQSDKPIPWLKVASMALIGAAPTFAVAAFYWVNGHWFEFWQAMVTSNLAKQGSAPIRYFFRGLQIFLQLPIIVILVVAAFRCSLRNSPYRSFLVFWLIAAFAGFFSVPNFYEHYALPLIAPLCVIAASEFDRRTLGVIAAALIMAAGAVTAKIYDFEWHRTNRENMNQLAAMIRDHAPRGSLLAFDAPPLLYSLSGTRP